jgi:hypothetical protein
MRFDRVTVGALLTFAITALPAPAAGERTPSAPKKNAEVSDELLEFLGGFDTSGGKPVDPFWFAGPAEAAPARSGAAPTVKSPAAAHPETTP